MPTGRMICRVEACMATPSDSQAAIQFSMKKLAYLK